MVTNGASEGGQADTDRDENARIRLQTAAFRWDVRRQHTLLQEYYLYVPDDEIKKLKS